MESTTYRCYYDDGTIITDAAVCPLFNDNGSALVTSELTIIEDVISNKTGWLFLLLLVAITLAKKGK